VALGGDSHGGGNTMKGRERFSKALRREPITGHVPHFELVFYLTMEVLGKVHPEQRGLGQWKQMSAIERELQLQDAAATFIGIAKKYNHDAIFVHPSRYDMDYVERLLEIIRERTGDDFFLMMHGDCTYSMPDGNYMLDFTARMYEDEDGLREEAKRNLDNAVNFAKQLEGKGLLDGFACCSDYCFNTNPFFTREQFGIFVQPYLKDLIAAYHDMGFFAIKHTDGNMMPILDQMLDCKPDAFHSIDPQGGMDLKYMKEYCGDKVCLIGNVNCGLLQTGTDEEVREDVLRSLRDGMAGYGYIFSTSNCVYAGLSLERYELMHRLWREYGKY
jgi:uroporphyrinogen decarboxylase